MEIIQICLESKVQDRGQQIRAFRIAGYSPSVKCMIIAS
jgi:hypothetical protein